MFLSLPAAWEKLYGRAGSDCIQQKHEQAKLQNQRHAVLLTRCFGPACRWYGMQISNSKRSHPTLLHTVRVIPPVVRASHRGQGVSTDSPSSCLLGCCVSPSAATADMMLTMPLISLLAASLASTGAACCAAARPARDQQEYSQGAQWT
jgi:hypothetical protein